MSGSGYLNWLDFRTSKSEILGSMTETTFVEKRKKMPMATDFMQDLGSN